MKVKVCDGCGDIVAVGDDCHRCLRAEVGRLRAIVEKLPNTADGVPVVPGAKYFLLEHDRGCLPLVVEGCCLNVSSQGTPLQLEIYETVSPAIRLPGRLYSTREAAEAAGEE